jgi:hypothetical protein
MSTLDTIRQEKFAGSLRVAPGAFEVKAEAFDGVIEVVDVWVEPNREEGPAALDFSIVKYEPDVDGSGSAVKVLLIPPHRETACRDRLVFRQPGESPDSRSSRCP